VSFFATWDPAFKCSSPVITLSGGNLTAAIANTGVTGLVRATLGFSTGKWYWEVHCDSISTGSSIGLIDGTEVVGSAPGYSANGDGWVNLLSGAIINNTNNVSGLGTFANGDTIGIAMDCDARTIKWYKNGSLLATLSGAGNVPSGTAWYPALGSTGNAGANTTTTNFGASTFAFTPPAGYIGLQDVLARDLWGDGNVLPAHTLVAGTSGVVQQGPPLTLVAGMDGLSTALPPYTIDGSASFLDYLIATLAAYTLDATLISGSLNIADNVFPIYDADATAISGAVGSGDSTLPPHALVADFGWFANNDLPAYTLNGLVRAGEIIVGDLELPAYTLAATLSSPFTMSASSTLPAYVLNASVLPGGWDRPHSCCRHTSSRLRA
jgi:hypothetical protein